MKRITLFLLTNVAVLVVLSVVAHLLGVDRVLTQSGLDMTALLGFSAVFGMGGSLLSLLASKWIAKRATGAQVIETPRTEVEHWLVSTVEGQARAVGIGMPEVAIYESDDVNAFATGASKNKALVAVSTGLLRHMTRDEAEAVLAHEVSHVANGDMVTLTLLQGVLNTFVIFASRAVAFAVETFMRRDEESPRSGGAVFFIVQIVLQLTLGVLASLLVAWFSRYRELRADAGGASLAGTPRMVAALERLKANESSALPQSLAAFGISGGTSGLLALFRSHPPLEERIAKLREAGSRPRQVDYVLVRPGSRG